MHIPIGSGGHMFRDANFRVKLCGSPGAGKSTFYWKQLQPLGYERVNQDILKSVDKCIKVADEYLRSGRSVAVDNTNADAAVRGKWIQLSIKHSIPIRCVLMTTHPQVCEHNDVVRALNKIVCNLTQPIFPELEVSQRYWNGCLHMSISRADQKDEPRTTDNTPQHGF